MKSPRRLPLFYQVRFLVLVSIYIRPFYTTFFILPFGRQCQPPNKRFGRGNVKGSKKKNKFWIRTSPCTMIMNINKENQISQIVPHKACIFLTSRAIGASSGELHWPITGLGRKNWRRQAGICKYDVILRIHL